MREGYKMTELGEMPENWEVVKFIEVMVLQRGFDLPSISRTPGAYPLIASNGKIDTHNTFKVAGPIIVTGRSGTIGKVYYEEENSWPLNTTLYVKEIYKNDSKFLYYFLLNFDLKRFSTGTGVPTLNRNIVHTEKVLLPPVYEQQKIAEILTTVDDKLEIINTQITQTQELKKGLMQQLLTKGIGHTKFKDSVLGVIPESWEVVELGDVTKLQGGFAFKSTDASLVGGIRWLKIANVSPNKIIWDDASYLPLNFGLIYIDYLLKNNDIVIAMTRPILGDKLKIAKVTINDHGSLLNQRVGRVVVKENVSSNFIYQVLSSIEFVSSLNKEIRGTDPPNISSTMFENIKIIIPPLLEQQNIAEILNSIDEKLEVLNMKKHSFTDLKKGLMQQLLTGKIRVK